MIRHNLDEDDEKLVQRWKGNGLGVYTQEVPDDDEHTNDKDVVFSASGFELRVPSAMYGVPIFNQDERDVLKLFLDELEAAPQVVRL